MATILVIDPLKSSRAVTAHALTAVGQTVIEAATARGAIAALRDLRPDCVVTDLAIAGLNGHRFLSRLRDADAKVPIIVLAEDAQSGAALCGEPFGISGLLEKPARAEDLRASVERALSQRQGLLECV
jgi:CheY-like chemotaxis protein